MDSKYFPVLWSDEGTRVNLCLLFKLSFSAVYASVLGAKKIDDLRPKVLVNVYASVLGSKQIAKWEEMCWILYWGKKIANLRLKVPSVDLFWLLM